MRYHPGRTFGITRQVYEALFAEIAQAMAIPKNTLAYRILRCIFGRAALRFTRLAVELDRRVQQGGVAAGARWILRRFVTGFDAHGTELIPLKGPLIIASNHPASYDSLIISACVPRPNYKIIIGQIPFLQILPNISRFGIYSPNPEDVYGRMGTVRNCIRHLKNGGSLLIFPRGHIEPDPDFMYHADNEFHQWSRSLEIFLRSVPETQVLVTIVSGVISQKAFRYPITWLRKLRPDKQRLAFIYQMIRQALSGKELFSLHPRVTFGELLSSGDHETTPKVIEAAARRALSKHLSFQGI